MKKHLANITTGLRIIGSAVLLFLDVPSLLFCITYLLCGFSDMIDGTIARKTNAVSRFGSKLDTVADFTFMAACSIKILPLIRIPIWLWVWSIIVALVKMFHMALVFIQKKELISIHSALNKTTGFALFLLPLLLTFVENTYSVATICALATMAVMQEVYLIAKGQEVI